MLEDSLNFSKNITTTPKHRFYLNSTVTALLIISIFELFFVNQLIFKSLKRKTLQYVKGCII